MPKENTHLWFAYSMLSHTDDRNALRLLSKNINDYLLGSISPDTFFYESRNNIEELSVYIHGESGSPTNETIITCLDNSSGERDLAFIMGFITHCALDIVWHPVIYYLTGNYYNSDPHKMLASRYRHSLFETALDMRIGHRLRIDILLRKCSFDGLAFQEILSRKFNKCKTALTGALKKQLFLNKLFESSAAHRILKPFIENDLIGSSNLLGLFYSEAESKFPGIAEGYQIKDIISGEERNVTTENLFMQSFEKASSMLDAAWSYYRKRISKDDLILSIPGEDLSTGKSGYYVKDLRYTLPD